MTTTVELPLHALQRFSTDPGALYPIDVVAHLTRLPRHLILVCYKNGLVDAAVDPDYGGYYFDQDAIRILQRIEYLHQQCGINLAGMRIILGLMDEVERLRAELNARD
jgi:MerR family transcriptional regulator, heat shock protein HspR